MAKVEAQLGEAAGVGLLPLITIIGELILPYCLSHGLINFPAPAFPKIDYLLMSLCYLTLGIGK